MKKTVLLLFLTVTVTSCIHAQQWFSLNGGFTSSGQFDGVYALCKDSVHNRLWAAGQFISTETGDTVNNIAWWDGTTWNPLQHSGFIGTSPRINCLTMYHNKLIIGLNLINVPYTKMVIEYDIDNGNSNQILGTFDGNINCFYIFNDTLFVGGEFSSFGNSIVKWNGTTFEPLGNGILGEVNSICSYNGQLIAAGYFEFSGSTFCKNIALWNGYSWLPVGNGIGGPPGNFDVFPLQAVCNYNNKLYAGGEFDSSFYVPGKGLIRWNGSLWESIGANLNSVRALYNFENKLYVGAGTCYSPFNPPWTHIVSYNETIWKNTGKGPLSSGVSGVQCFCDFNNELIVGGRFNYIDDTPYVYAGFVARYDSSSDTTGIKEIKNSGSVTVFPNPVTTTVTLEYQTAYSGKSTVTVENCLGQTIQTQQLTNNHKHTIDMSSYASGIYFIKCFDGKQQTVVKVVKE
ncbi:MAG: T9SS type A sorting domain-containing protein [Bacteroidota bacterium]